jgi:hypothetical protein
MYIGIIKSTRHLLMEYGTSNGESLFTAGVDGVVRPWFFHGSLRPSVF